MKTAVGIPCSETARFSLFYDSLLHVRGVTHENVIMARGANVAENRNAIAEEVLAKSYDAVLYADDDQALLPETLERLLAHDKDIVSGLYLARESPFVPMMFEIIEARNCVKLLSSSAGGLVPIVAAGAGCLLVKATVFKIMERPWWRLGQIDKVGWSDDIDFCSRARQAGFSLWCDLDCLVGHQTQAVVWPHRTPDGEWVTGLMIGNEAVAVLPAAHV